MYWMLFLDRTNIVCKSNKSQYQSTNQFEIILYTKYMICVLNSLSQKKKWNAGIELMVEIQKTRLKMQWLELTFVIIRCISWCFSCCTPTKSNVNPLQLNWTKCRKMCTQRCQAQNHWTKQIHTKNYWRYFVYDKRGIPSSILPAFRLKCAIISGHIKKVSYGNWLHVEFVSFFFLLPCSTSIRMYFPCIASTVPIEWYVVAMLLYNNKKLWIKISQSLSVYLFVIALVKIRSELIG